MTPDELRAACDEVARRVPDADLIKNQVGNLAIIDRDGYFVGYVDLRTGEVEITGSPPSGAE